MPKNNVLWALLLFGTAPSSALGETIAPTISAKPWPPTFTTPGPPGPPVIPVNCSSEDQICLLDKSLIDTCKFKDEAQVVRVAQNLSLDAALIVESCLKRVCPMLNGPGNPDITGIGMMISYLIQLVTTLLFGPLYLAAYRLSHRDDKTLESGSGDQMSQESSTSLGRFITDFIHSIDSLREIQNTVTDTNVAFTIAIGIGTIHQSCGEQPGLYEHVFLKRLGTAQLSLAFCSITSQVGTGWTRTSLAQRKSAGNQHSKNPVANVQKGLILMLYLLATSTITVIAIYQLVSDDQSLETSWIIKRCPGPAVTPPDDYYKSGETVAILSALVSICIFEIPAYLVYFLISKLHRFAAVSFFVLSTAYLMVAVYLIGDGWMCRETVAGPDNKSRDKEWGFGQVTALVLWLPLTIQILLKIEGLFFIFWRRLFGRGSKRNPPVPALQGGLLG